jgi:hypothetical protein
MIRAERLGFRVLGYRIVEAQLQEMIVEAVEMWALT